MISSIMENFKAKELKSKWTKWPRVDPLLLGTRHYTMLMKMKNFKITSSNLKMKNTMPN
jgi:hypothetical protein